MDVYSYIQLYTILLYMIKSGDVDRQVSTLEMVNGKAALVTTPPIKGRRTISTADLRAVELFYGNFNRYCNSGIVYIIILYQYS